MNDTMTARVVPPAWPMFRALVGVGMFCGLVIVLVYLGTLPAITKNRAEALEKAIFAVLPAATSRQTFTLTDEQRFVLATEGSGERVHAGYDADGNLVGVAIEAAGMGYADTIEILYGYAPVTETVVGFQVLATKETPGLGDKIEKDPVFLDNFTALDVRLDAARALPLNPVVTVKSGTKTEAWQIDGITGATVSSVAIGDIIAASTTRWLPLIVAELNTLAAGYRPAPEPGADNDES
jgi:electron transport complex protein RnfG